MSARMDGIRLRCVLLTMALCLMASTFSSAADTTVAVIYPDIGEPYHSFFDKIIEGVASKARIASFPVGNNSNTQQLADELHRLNIQKVVVLGRNGIKAAFGLGQDMQMVAGGIISAPEFEIQGMRVHSLAPDPALLFARMTLMMPSVKRVYVVYDPRQTDWLMVLAREAAKSQRLEFVSYEAQDLKTAARLYLEIFSHADARTDALWLPQDSTTVDDSTVLPLILQESWKYSLAIFSSSLSHVRRDILFSLYPNNVELGRSLANSVLSLPAAQGKLASSMVPLEDVQAAVNVRTASHLGLNIKQQNFDLVFPEQ